MLMQSHMSGPDDSPRPAICADRVWPLRLYPALQLDPNMPRLPYSLPAMEVIALVPPVWFRMMDTRVERVLARASRLAET